MMKLRDEAKASFRHTKSRGGWEYYKSLRNLTNKTFRAEKRAYFDYISRTRNSQSLWKHLNLLGLKKQEKINIPSSLKDPDTLNNFFARSVLNINIGSSVRYA
ncbi:hypothetical protein QE152_g3564 [Popillia japonica]|uniref:Ribosomal protein L20 n=1 Tax=Popillia japonica TaxID=7064 RepID=A0AAW1N6T7_POPJA